MSEIIKFYKDGCAPCKMVDNFLNDNNVEYKNIDVFEQPEIASAFDISTVPTVVLVEVKSDSSTELKRTVGYKPDELTEILSLL